MTAWQRAKLFFLISHVGKSARSWKKNRRIKVLIQGPLSLVLQFVLSIPARFIHRNLLVYLLVFFLIEVLLDHALKNIGQIVVRSGN